jgi:hypothetical protein
MLYTLLTDSNHYLDPLIDIQQIDRLVGEVNDDTIELHIELNNAPRSFKGIFNEALKVGFPQGTKEQKNCSIPEIAVFEGRLFLSKRAYEAVEPLIKHDGEFLSATYEQGEGFIFTPMHLAETVGGLDKKLTRKNDWGDLEHLAFHEDKLKHWQLFRTEYEHYRGLHCQPAIKTAIEDAELKGLYITADLGRIFPCEPDLVTKLN